MDDLIRRKDALELLDKNGVVYRAEFEALPTIDAIPVEWLKKYMQEPIFQESIYKILFLWRKEQEAQSKQK